MRGTSFLAGLATRGAAAGLVALRPDVWRGRELAAPETAANPTPATAPSMEKKAGAAPPAAPLATHPIARRPAPEPATAAAVDRPPPPPAEAEIVHMPMPAQAVPAMPSRPAAVPSPPDSPTETVAATPLPEAVVEVRQFMAPNMAVPRPDPPATTGREVPPVQPRPRPLAPPPAPPVAEAAPEPVIEVSIGRIEWRAPPPPAPPPAARAVPRTTGFAGYAALRAGIDRGRR